LLHFHGIGEDLGKVNVEIATLGEMLGVNVLAVEYPGYGLNFHRGVTTAEDIDADAKVLLAFLTNELKVRTKDLIVYGRSMGTAVAIRLVAQL